MSDKPIHSEIVGNLLPPNPILQVDSDRSSLVHSFPVELLIEIFSWYCCQSNLDICDKYADGLISATTLTLSHVCSHWRSIILSKPELWSYMNIYLWNETPKVVNLLNLYLLRSFPALLTLNIDGRDQEDYCSHTLGPQGHLMFMALLNEYPRWGAASLNLHWTTVVATLDNAQVQAQSQNQLHSLALEWHVQHDEEYDFEMSASGITRALSTLMRNTPLLSSLRIHAIRFQESFLHTPNNLKTVALRTISPSCLSTLFHLSPRLEDVTVGITRGITESTPQIRCTTLRCLRVSFYNGSDHASPTISALCLPSLTKLVVTAYWRLSTSDSSLLEAFKTLVSHSPQLRYLTLNGPLLNSAEMITLFALLPHLTHLTILIDKKYDNFLTTTLLKRLVFQPTLSVSSVNLFPRLQYLHLAFQDVNDLVGPEETSFAWNVANTGLDDEDEDEEALDDVEKSDYAEVVGKPIYAQNPPDHSGFEVLYDIAASRVTRFDAGFGPLKQLKFCINVVRDYTWEKRIRAFRSEVQPRLRELVRLTGLKLILGFGYDEG